MKYTAPKLIDHLASSYVIGTLNKNARRRFEVLAKDRYDIRLSVMQWSEQMSKLEVSTAPVEPPAHIWAKVKSRTLPTAQEQPDKGWIGLRGTLRPVLSGFGGFAGGIALMFAVFMLYPALLVTTDKVAMRSGELLPQSYVGLLVDSEQNGKILLSSLRFGKTAVIKVIGPITPPKSGHLILWAMPTNAPPFRIGEVPLKGSAQFILANDSEKLFAKVSKLSVTLETSTAPEVMSETVVFRGNCAKLW